MIFKLFWLFRALFYSLFFIKKLGLKSYLGKPIFFMGLSRLSIGSRFRLYPGWRIEILSKGAITISDDVSIGQGLHLIAVDNELTIGRGVVISSDVLITNSDHTFEVIDIPIYMQPMLTKKTAIGDNCFIGTGAKILAGTELGCQCIVGANSVVKGAFPDYSVIAGNPARVIKKYDMFKKEWLKVTNDESNTI